MHLIARTPVDFLSWASFHRHSGALALQVLFSPSAALQFLEVNPVMYLYLRRLAGLYLFRNSRRGWSQGRLVYLG